MHNYCPTHAMRCGNGSSRTQHPSELLGDDWYRYGDWGIDSAEAGNENGNESGSEPATWAGGRS